MQMTRMQRLAVKIGLAAAGLTAFIILVHSIGLGRLTPEALRKLIVACGWWGPAVYILLYTLRPLLLFPAIILTLAGGLAFGPWWGTLYVVIGGLGGAAVCFALARYLGRERVQQYLGRYVPLEMLEDQSREYGFRTLLMMRLVPVFPYDPVSYLCGLSAMRWRDYLAATTLGMIPGAVAYNVLGYSMSDIFSPTFLLAVLLLVVVMGTPLVYHYVKHK